MKSLFERSLLVIVACCLSFSMSAWAQDVINEGFDPTKDFISDKYMAGTSLIYDCLDRHWVCTGESEYQACVKERAINISIKRTELPCVASEVFASKRECFARAKTLVARGNIPKTCLHPLERQRFIGFR